MRLELFRTFDRQGKPLGLVPRHEVHRRGLWHKSAHVFLFDSADRLLMQQRAADKDLYAGLWDYSVGEHLHDGETFLAGAQRGLLEELGIAVLDLHALGAVRFVEITGDGYADREIQQAFRGVYDGVLKPDPVEIAQVRHIERQSLAAWIASAPQDFTPWFVADVNEFGFLS